MKKKKLLGLWCILAIMLTSCSFASPKQTQETERSDFSRFTAKDIQGNAVTEQIFAEHELTMINIWATFCSPCLREMPELGEISQAYQDQGVQIIGIVVDVLDNDGHIVPEQVKIAKEIVDKTGAGYKHLLPSADLTRIKLQYVTGVPETIFVNRKGEIVGESYLGAKNKDDWIKIIEKTRKAS